MFDGKIFYHNITRKAIVAFGVMFNNLQVRRRDNSNNIIQTLKIPLAYAPKSKMLARIEQYPVAEQKQFNVLLPRMSFEVVGFEYDGQRKINSMNQVKVTQNETQARRVYGPTPYNLTVNLYVYSKNQDDGLQIFEQIVPAFNPDFSVTVNYIPELGIKHDLPIILNSVSYEDDYEGDLTTRRMIIWTYTFTLKLYYYGPVERQNIIRTAIASVFNDPDLEQKLDKYTITTDPADALPDDEFIYVKTVDSNAS
jgi:hypothetical protein